MACERGLTDVCELLISKGANVNARTVGPNIGYYSDRCDGNCDDMSVQNNWINQTPLHLAAQGYSVDICKLLIDKGADVNVKTKDQWTPLHFAVRSGSFQVCEFLIRMGAGVNAQTTDLLTPLQLTYDCICWDRKEIIKLLIDSGAHNDCTDLNYFIDKKTDLHAVAQRGSTEIGAYLIDNGADIEALDNRRRTPLHIACTWDNVDVAKLLVENGANLEALDESGRTPLHLACQWDNADVAKLLIDKGANIEAQTPYEYEDESSYGKENGETDLVTPLHLATIFGKKNICELLVNGGADLNACTSSKRDTCLHLAARFNSELGVSFLNYTMDYAAQNKRWQTAAELARRFGNDWLANKIEEKIKSVR